MTTTETTDISGTARDLVGEALREFPRGGKLNLLLEGRYAVGSLMQQVHTLAQKRGIQTTGGAFWPAVTEYVWTLARIGALALMPQDPSPAPSHEEQRNISTFIVTELGHRLLSEANFSPQDWAKYKAATLVRVSAPDDVVIAYLAEAVEAWQRALYRSSVVMLGCACERLILLLAQEVRDASLVPYSEKVKKMLASSKPVGVSELFEQVRRALVEAANLPPGLHDAIDRKLSPIFEHARVLRNAHGHPTGEPATREEAEAGLKLFPGFYELVDKLTQHLRAPSG